MQILVPLDGSPLAELALITAAELAQRLPDPTGIIVLRVLSTPGAVSFGALNPLMTGQHYFASALETADDYLRTVAHLPSLTQVEVRRQVMVGAVAPTIIAQAQALSVDLIIMTTHGRTGLRLQALGSIAEGVVHEATVPVLLVREHHTPFTAQPQVFTILVPLDGSELAERTLRAVVPYAQALRATLLLVRVLPSEPHPIVREIAQHAALTTLRGWDALLAEQHVPVQHLVVFGEVQAHLADIARTHHIALIAMATHGRTGVDRLLHGSVAATLTHHTMLPVLIVHG